MDLLLRQNPRVRLHESDGETTITFRNSDRVLEMDRMAARIFVLCDGKHTLEQVEALARRELGEASRETEFSDLFSKSLEQLLEKDALSLGSLTARPG